MSDLQCPATFLVARPGDAAYPVPGALSDHGGRLTDLGRRQAAGLAGSLAARRVAALYTSRMSRAIQTGEVIAASLGVRTKAVDGLQEFAPGAETGLDVLRRYEAALSELADVHRGETVVVISHGGVMSLVLPRLADNVPDDLGRQRVLPNCAPVEATVDGDGWQLVFWPGTTDRSVR